LLREKTLSPASGAVACAKAVIPLIRIPTTAKNIILNLLIQSPFLQPRQNRRRVIISPESGIHRPSYNGAPASQTPTAILVAYPFCELKAKLFCAPTCTILKTVPLNTRWIKPLC
jgi:hypothetical protein